MIFLGETEKKFWKNEDRGPRKSSGEFFFASSVPSPRAQTL
jgi:hypothetical protein